MNAADRDKRNARAMQLFLGGATYRAIAATLSLEFAKITAPGVHKIVQQELAASAQRRLLLSDEAYAMHQERTERLFLAHWPTATDASNENSHRSALVCQRILVQQARMYGLEDGGSSGLPAPTPTPTGPRDDDDGEDSGDELARLRAERNLG